MVVMMKFTKNSTMNVITTELLTASPTALGPPWALVKLSGDNAPGAAGAAGELVFSGDGTRLLYSATQDDPNAQELYVVDFDDGVPTAPIKVNHVLADGENVSFGARISAGGTRAVYRVRIDADNSQLIVPDSKAGLLVYIPL